MLAVAWHVMTKDVPIDKLDDLRFDLAEDPPTDEELTVKKLSTFARYGTSTPVGGES